MHNSPATSRLKQTLVECFKVVLFGFVVLLTVAVTGDVLPEEPGAQSPWKLVVILLAAGVTAYVLHRIFNHTEETNQ